jgi:glycosyltransferase involved in cell wall biosynthesis
MRVGVYNRHWSTMGGGERFAGGIAEALLGEHAVDLIGHEPIDVPTMTERLQLDLTGVHTVVIGDEPGAVTEASSPYDLFVNTSYLSHDPSQARASILVVHFPAKLERGRPALRPLAQPVLDRVFGAHTTIPAAWGDGFHAPLRGRRHTVAWTNGAGEMQVRPTGDTLLLHLSFGRILPPAVGPTRVDIEVDGTVVRSVVIEPATGRLPTAPVQVRVAVPARPDGELSHVVLRSPSFVPAELLGSDDRRQLGVPLLLADEAGIGGKIDARLGVATSPRQFVRSYDVVAANSRFTQGFISRWWKTPSEVLHPPVGMFEPGRKEPIVLSVGRFFRADRGHSKKQLEMVRAFRRVHEQSERARNEGWELHLVGGCAPDDRPYLQEVERSAEGLPVVFHIGTSGSELESLYERASLFWSATGLGEDERDNPVRFEHFGISTVEAMSAGIVPIVLDKAGGIEIVRHGDQGLHFTSEADLVTQTVRVIDDEDLRGALATAATVRARAFARPRFAAELQRIVDLARTRAGIPDDLDR